MGPMGPIGPIIPDPRPPTPDPRPMSQGFLSFADTPDWLQAAQDDVLLAEIVFNLPLERPYTYRIPEPLRGRLQAGQRVQAPLGRGNRSSVGYCVSVHPAERGKARGQLKDIESLLDDEPLLDAQMLSLTQWIGERYLCGWGQVLDSVIPAGVRHKSGTREVQHVRLAPAGAEALAKGAAYQCAAARGTTAAAADLRTAAGGGSM